MFGYLFGQDAEIRNLILNSADVNAPQTDYVGSLVGYLNEASIVNCGARNVAVVGEQFTGGLVGRIYYGHLEESFFTGSVRALQYAGGLAGYNMRGSVSNCYSAGLVYGDDQVGGLFGNNNNYYSGSVYNCYAAAVVDGTSNVGGVVGSDYSGCYTTCFWDQTINLGLPGLGNSADPNVTGLSSVEMKTRDTYTDAGWDFVGEVVNGTEDIWDICEGSNYPKFVWQIPAWDFLCPDGTDFFDYSYLAERWAEQNCADSNGCDGADLDLSGSVDANDVKILCDHWLEGAGP
jgi:hypothetical protein